VLVKLVRWAEGEGDAPPVAEETGLDALLSQARLALDQLDDGDDDEP
jgi:hypothetical protein